MKGFVNLKPLPHNILEKGRNPFCFDISVIPNLLRAREIAAFLASINSHEMVPVGVDGILKNYKEGEQIGSWRTSFFNEDVAETLSERVGACFKKDVMINPLLRVIRYEPGGVLIPHYDSGHDESTLSLVIYLDGGDDGCTEFMLDDRYGQKHDYEDRPDYESPVLARILPVGGVGVIFPHRVLHRGQKSSFRKTIIRTDIRVL